MNLLRTLIGLLCCLHLLRLAKVITLVLVLRHSIGNRSQYQVMGEDGFRTAHGTWIFSVATFIGFGVSRTDGKRFWDNGRLAIYNFGDDNLTILSIWSLGHSET